MLPQNINIGDCLSGTQQACNLWTDLRDPCEVDASRFLVSPPCLLLPRRASKELRDPRILRHLRLIVSGDTPSLLVPPQRASTWWDRQAIAHQIGRKGFNIVTTLEFVALFRLDKDTDYADEKE